MFNIDDFKAGKIAVICTSEEQARLFHNIVGDAGVEWINSGDPRRSFLFEDRAVSEKGGIAYHCCFSNHREGMSYSNLDFLIGEHPNKYDIVFFSSQIDVDPEQFISLLQSND